MKIKITFLMYSFSFIVFSSFAFAQISITSADATAINAVGNVLTNHIDSMATSIDIGSPGATSWDFSALTSHYANTFTGIVPSSGPYHSSDYPTSNVVFHYDTFLDIDTADGWQYTTQNAGDYSMNGVITHSVIGSDTFLVKSLYSPTQLFYPLPYTYNDQWASDFTITNTTYYNGFPFLTTYAYHTEAVTVDAWGNMTMPGGVVVAALRVRRDDRYTSPSPPFYVRTVSYSFMSKFGDMVEATAIDTNVSNSGVIQTEGVSWRRSDLVSVGKEDYTPAKYSLSQNYPNPFNPSTNISFSVGTYSHTFLRVYDILGREVETIFSGVLSAGNYTKQWNAKNYPSGVYFYRLQAGTFTETKKLVLLK